MLFTLVRRNCKLFFKDKGMFFSALITPLILLLLYSTFLANTYRDSFISSFPEGFSIDDKLVGALVGGQLLASLLAVSCVTVTFCVNLIMIQDKVTGALKDLTIAPVKKTTVAYSYYVSTLLCSVLINTVALCAGLIYLHFNGWYLEFADILLTFLDIVIIAMFATALSSILCFPLKTQGASSAVGTLVSSVYGFICGAYMPISNFGKGLQTVLSFLPGTYGTSLVKNHILRGSFEALSESGMPDGAVSAIRSAIDCDLKFFDNHVSLTAMYVIMIVSILVMICVYVFMNYATGKRSVN